jgi:hypothetical protein
LASPDKADLDDISYKYTQTPFSPQLAIDTTFGFDRLRAIRAHGGD